MSRLSDYIKAHELDPGDDPGPVNFEQLLESVNNIDWDGVNEYMDKLLREEDSHKAKDE